jgi:hypothetical protein
MSRANEERYVFETEWFDIQASLIRKYLFTFYPADNTIEMVSHYQNIKVSKKILLIKKAKICRDQSK